jgi:hypothetical protein
LQELKAKDEAQAKKQYVMLSAAEASLPRKYSFTVAVEMLRLRSA